MTIYIDIIWIKFLIKFNQYQSIKIFLDQPQIDPQDVLGTSLVLMYSFTGILESVNLTEIAILLNAGCFLYKKSLEILFKKEQ